MCVNKTCAFCDRSYFRWGRWVLLLSPFLNSNLCHIVTIILQKHWITNLSIQILDQFKLIYKWHFNIANFRKFPKVKNWNFVQNFDLKVSQKAQNRKNSIKNSFHKAIIALVYYNTRRYAARVINFNSCNKTCLMKLIL